MTLRFDGGLAADCSFGGAIMGSVSLRMGFNVITADDFVDEKVDDETER